MVERAQLSTALSEEAFGISGLINSAAAAKIGQLTGAKVLVSGQVVKISDARLVFVANIVGTETGRLFAAKVEGGADRLLDLTSQLSDKIAQTISDQRTNLLASVHETREDRLARIIKSAVGTNRPSVSVMILEPRAGIHPSYIINAELSSLLLKAGFTLADDNSDRKPDVLISGGSVSSAAPQPGSQSSVTVHVTGGEAGPGGLPTGSNFAYTITENPGDGSPQYDLTGFERSETESVDFKVQNRRSGDILMVDHVTGSAQPGSSTGAGSSASVSVADAVAEKVLPLLAK